MKVGLSSFLSSFLPYSVFLWNDITHVPIPKQNSTMPKLPWVSRILSFIAELLHSHYFIRIKSNYTQRNLWVKLWQPTTCCTLNNYRTIYHLVLKQLYQSPIRRTYETHQTSWWIVWQDRLQSSNVYSQDCGRSTSPCK